MRFAPHQVLGRDCEQITGLLDERPGDQSSAELVADKLFGSGHSLRAVGRESPDPLDEPNAIGNEHRAILEANGRMKLAAVIAMETCVAVGNVWGRHGALREKGELSESKGEKS